jgi:hypothetical protein
MRRIDIIVLDAASDVATVMIDWGAGCELVHLAADGLADCRRAGQRATMCLIVSAAGLDARSALQRALDNRVRVALDGKPVVAPALQAALGEPWAANAPGSRLTH